MPKPVQIPGMPTGWLIIEISTWSGEYEVDIATPQNMSFPGSGESFVDAMREALDPDTIYHESGDFDCDLPPSYPTADQLVALLHSGDLDEMLTAAGIQRPVKAVAKPIAWPAPSPPVRTPKACAPDDVATIVNYACSHVLPQGYYGAEQDFIETGKLADHLYQGHHELDHGAFAWNRNNVSYRKNGGEYVWVRLTWAEIRAQLQQTGTENQLGLFGEEAA